MQKQPRLFNKERSMRLVNGMKIFLLLTLLCVFSVAAENSYSQSKDVSLNVTNITLKEAFRQIEKNSDYLFLIMDESESVLTKNVSVNVNNQSISHVLENLLRDTSLSYSIVNRQITIYKKGVEQNDLTDYPSVNKSMSIEQIKKKITGKVVGVDGEPIIGANVIEVGTTNGVATDINGDFQLTVSKNATIQITHLGYLKEEVKDIKDSHHFHIVMKENLKEINELVVTGYQNLDKREVVGSYFTIKADEILMPASASIDGMLQGQIPGMVVTFSSAKVGANPRIKIRGTSTLLGNTDPLWVVDGIIQPEPLHINTNDAMTTDFETLIGNQISWLNPNDIESITVLKDASATAIYGSRASNGVIVITTKTATKDRVNFNYRTSLSVRERPSYSKLNLMNSDERVLFSMNAFDIGAHYSQQPFYDDKTYESLLYSYLNRQIDRAYYDQRVNELRRVNTDWFDLLTRNSLSTQHYLGVNGSSGRTSYNASISFSDMKGIEKKNNSQNYGLRLRLGTQLSEKLRLEFSMVGQAGNGTGYSAGINPISYATRTSRAVEAYAPNVGEYSYYKRKTAYNKIPPNSFLHYNILNEIEHSGSYSKSSSLFSNLHMSWNISDALRYQVVGGYSVRSNFADSYAGEQTFFIANNYRGFDYGREEPGSPLYDAAMLPFGGRYLTANTEVHSYNMHHTLSYYKIFANKHRVNVLVGNDISSSNFRKVSNTVWGYVKERGEQIVKPTAPKNLKPISSPYEPGEDLGLFEDLYNGGFDKFSQIDNFVSLFATLAYSFDKRYVVNFNVRSDASNRFGQNINRQFDPTYSLGFSWKIAEEQFVKEKLSFIKDFSLRASYGVQGNALTNLSPDLIATMGSVALIYNQYYSRIRSLPNPNLSWERTHSWNLGLDMNLFNRINIGVEYYGRRSSAILEQPIPQEYGKNSMYINGGIITNQGVELMINTTPIKTKNWLWSIGFNTSRNVNKLESEPKKEFSLRDYLDGSGKILKKGYPVSAFWSYSYKGLNNKNGYPEFNKMDIEYDEMNSDMSQFLIYSGSREPLISGGLNTRLKYKNLSISGTFSIFLGGKKRLPALFVKDGYLPDPLSNANRDLLKNWKKPGDEQTTDIPALFHTGTRTIVLPCKVIKSIYEMWDQSDLRVANASFLRCNQISLTYDIPRSFCHMAHVNSLQVSGTLNNLFVIADKKFQGFDPELGDSIMPRIFSMSINLGF